MIGAILFIVVGGLMLAVGLLSPFMRRLPLTTAVIYLTVGTIVGPTVLGLFHFNPLKESWQLKVLTEAAVLISLFAAGVKLPGPMTWAAWRPPLLLAFVSMTITVGLVAVFAHSALGLSPGAAVLLGAIIAPTDPVLAGGVQVRSTEDRDRLRVTLTAEAGVNDGSGFPFVLLGLGWLGLHDLGASNVHWIIVDVIWSSLGGIAIGTAGGVAVAHLAAAVRRFHPSGERYDDFLGLGLIGAVYGVSTLADAGGFLAVFFAAVALRQTELRIAATHTDVAQVSVESLVFKEHLERLSEILLVLLIGGTLFVDSWSWRAVGLALFLFFIARPVSVLIGLAATRMTWPMRGMTAWFGVRGIGSLFYLMYAIDRGLPEPIALELIHLTLVVVALSILMHGVSVNPMMMRYRQWRKARESAVRD